MYWSLNGKYHLHKKEVRPCDVDGSYVEMYDVHPDDCNCDLHCDILLDEFAPHNKYVSYRTVCGHRRSEKEMVADIADQISSRWRLQPDGELQQNSTASLFMSALHATEGMHFCNAFTIPTYRHDCPVQSNDDLFKGWAPEVPPMVIEAYKRWDMKYFSLVLPSFTTSRQEMEKYVWHTVHFNATYSQGTPYNMTTVNGQIPSLQMLALRACSVFNQVLGHNKRGPNSIYSMTDLFPKKHLAEVAKHNHPTHTTNQYLRGISGLIPTALQTMYGVTGWDKLKGCKTFKWSPDLIDNLTVPLTSSSGYRPGPSGSSAVEIDVAPGYKIRYSVDGPKSQQIDYARAEAKKLFEEAIKDKVEIPEIYYTNVRKNEVFNSRNDKENEKFNLKNRIFTIPSFVTLLCSMVVNGFRQKVERGAHIAIGHNWFWGGAQRIANLMRYKEKGQVIELADFWRYDKTILAHLLFLYSSFSSYYYSDNGDIEVLLRMVDAVASALAIKPITFIGNVCKLMMGVMPSGAYETSHGDSWINLFLFCVFFTYQQLMFPHLASQMRQDFYSKLIMYIVYGDDNLSSYPRCYKKVLGIQVRRKFFLKFFDMKLRDCETHDYVDGHPGLLSRVDRITCNVLHQGPMFLQNSFIHKSDVIGFTHDMCEVLPFRSHWKTMAKFAFGSGMPRLPLDYVAAAIGHAYDTKGTNRIGYEFCSFMYDYFLPRAGKSWEHVCDQLLHTKHSVSATRLFRKCGMDVEVIAQGFPTLDRLLSMHVYDPDSFNDSVYLSTFNMLNSGKVKPS